MISEGLFFTINYYISSFYILKIQSENNWMMMTTAVCTYPMLQCREAGLMNMENWRPGLKSYRKAKSMVYCPKIKIIVPYKDNWFCLISDSYYFQASHGWRTWIFESERTSTTGATAWGCSKKY